MVWATAGQFVLYAGSGLDVPEIKASHGVPKVRGDIGNVAHIHDRFEVGKLAVNITAGAGEVTLLA
jgi:hypothetical protein